MPTEPDIRIVEPMCAVFRRQLKSVGLKYTPERARILDTVLAFVGPFEAEQLIASLRESAARSGFRVSKATVYRTLKLMQDAGILQQVLFTADTAHYQLAFAGHDTGVLVISDSNTIVPFDAPELAALMRRVCKEHNVSPQGQRYVIYATKK